MNKLRTSAERWGANSCGHVDQEWDDDDGGDADDHSKDDAARV